MEKYLLKNSKINHLGAKAVDDKYNDEIELSEIGIGCGLNFISIKNTEEFLFQIY